MRIIVLQPSEFDAAIQEAAGNDSKDGIIMTIEPRQRYAGQKLIVTVPLKVLTDNGTVVDKGMLAVNTVTGKLSYVKLKDDVKSPVDTGVVRTRKKKESK